VRRDLTAGSDEHTRAATADATIRPVEECSVEAALAGVSACGAALAAEVEHLTRTARALAQNHGAATPSARATGAAAALHDLQAREAELEFACLQLQGALIRWTAR